MPALVTGQYTNANLFYSSYIDTYMERDVRRLSSGIDSLKFLRFLRATAARAGQQVNYKGIADDARSTRPRPRVGCIFWRRWVLYFCCTPIPIICWKRTVSTPKLYFYDTGLVCYLTRWTSPETAMAGAMNGALLENFTVSRS